ncbi:MAG: hypothetical protein RLW62_01220 [Gammaproteobacteria bacterium]
MAGMLVTSAGAAAATSFSIDFAGVFDACDQACVDVGLAALAGTPFTGNITFPSSEQAADSVQHGTLTWPYLQSRSLYTFAPGAATFRLDTVTDVVAAGDAAVPRFIINDCLAAACPINGNWFWIASGEGATVAIFYLPTGPIDSTAFPSAAALAPMVDQAYFQITEQVGLGFIGTTSFSAGLTVLPPAEPVPLPPTAWLLAGAVLPCVRRRRLRVNAAPKDSRARTRGDARAATVVRSGPEAQAPVLRSAPVPGTY